MNTSKFDRICRENNIKVTTVAEGMAYARQLLFNSTCYCITSSPLADTCTIAGYNHIIALGDDCIDIDVIKWHELGHAMHSLGHGGELNILTKELAANTWALANYPTTVFKRQHIVDVLKYGIMTYINNGKNTSKHTPELEETAKILGVNHLITWI